MMNSCMSGLRYLSVTAARVYWRAVGEGCDQWWEICSYLFADKTKNMQTFDRYWWQAKIFHFMIPKLAALSPWEFPLRLFWLETLKCDINHMCSFSDMIYKVHLWKIFHTQEVSRGIKFIRGLTVYCLYKANILMMMNGWQILLWF